MALRVLSGMHPLRLAAAPGTVSLRKARAVGAAFHEEIPFMLVGDVPGPRPRRPRGRPGRRSRAKATRRRKARR
jgi:hypothetical protein